MGKVRPFCLRCIPSHSHHTEQTIPFHISHPGTFQQQWVHQAQSPKLQSLLAPLGACTCTLSLPVLLHKSDNVASGRAIALKLASSGYDVTISDLPTMKDAAEATAKEISDLGRKSNYVLGDVSVRSDVEKLVPKHVQHLGELYTMVANAGICQVKEALELSEEDVKRMFEVNVFGVFNCYQVAGNEMVKKGTKGRLIGCAR